MFDWLRKKSAALPAPAAPQGDALRQQGNALLAQDDARGAEQCYRQAIALDPHNAPAHVSLGFVLRHLGRNDEAQQVLQAALALDATDPDCHYLLGGLAEGRADFDAAARHYAAAFELKPDFELACREACRVLSWTGRNAEALRLIEAGLVANPGSADLHFYLGNLQLTDRSLGPALASYRRALALGADYPTLHGHMGYILRQTEDGASALVHLERAVALDPDNARNHCELGTVLYGLGRVAEAMAHQRTAIRLEPGLLAAHHRLLFALSFAADCPPDDYLRQARSFGEQASRAARTAPLKPLDARPPRGRLRVGWVSGDLRRHVVASFLEGVLRGLAGESLELIAFSNNPGDDEVTQRLRALMAEWHDIAPLGDAEAAALIRGRQVDVLVDLSGHTSETRLPVFAWRPAPVQVSWLGYFASTGLTEMDYFLADRVSVPEAARAHFSERIWYLPDTRLCLTPPRADDIQPSPLPAQRQGHVTFGSFQALAKMGDDTLQAWSQVLRRVPGSRLRLQVRHLERAGVREQLLQRLAQAGIDTDAVALHDGVPYEAYLRAHHEVDVILDTFPYPGGTTTAEALWMGVPTVTRAGGFLLARQGASMLHAADLADWIAQDSEDYCRIAVHWATDLDALAQLRGRLRRQVLASPLFDGPRFARHLSEAFHAMAAGRA